MDKKQETPPDDDFDRLPKKRIDGILQPTKSLAELEAAIMSGDISLIASHNPPCT